MVAKILGEKEAEKQPQLDKDHNSVQVFARNVNLQNEFNTICKFAFNPKVEDDFQENPMLHYFVKSEKEKVVSLPVLGKIKNKVLPLIGYKMNEGLCSSIARAFSVNKFMIHKVVLDGTGISDAAMAVLIEGMSHQETARGIVSRYNDFGEKALKALMPLLVRKRPRHFTELRLINCNMNQSVLHDLIEYLASVNTKLARLSLVKVQFNDKIFARLLQYISKNRNIREIDLSHN